MSNNLKGDLSDTITLMKSNNYKDRFVAEYFQTKIRYEKLKNITTKWEALMSKGEHIFDYEFERVLGFIPKTPFHVLREQQRCMGEYLHQLEIRTILEDIDLSTILDVNLK